MLVVDTVLQGRYRIARPLGAGGMGAVYQAIDERLNKTVAIKEVVFGLENAADAHQRDLLQKAFQREANSLVKAKHENVPDITDFFSEQDSLYLVMEYIEGDDFAKMLEKRGRPFSVEEVSPWIDQLLEALKYLHALNPPIYHRDVKPQNLKLNEWKKVKLLDFGIARSTDKNSTLSQHTFLAATLNYAPFEQVLRAIAPTFREFILLKHRDKAEKFLEQDTDARCDVFGVGATFYHLLTNQVPADVTKRALGIWEEGTDELADPSEINPEIPPGVSAWLLKAMAFERENRFVSASEMKDAFRRSIVESDKAPITSNLTHAKTERLIVGKETAEAISSLDKASPSTGAVRPGATEAIIPGAVALTDFNTGFSVQPTSANLTDQTFVNENRPADHVETQSDKVMPPPSKRPATNTVKYILGLALGGILVIVLGGVGLYALASYMSYAPPKESNTTSGNVNVSQTPETTPSIEENVITAGGSGEVNTGPSPETPGKEAQKTPPVVAQPTAEQTPRVTPEQTPRPTLTPKPTPTRTPGSGGTRYVLCYVVNPNGTTTKVRKNNCNECPPRTACELIY